MDNNRRAIVCDSRKQMLDKVEELSKYPDKLDILDVYMARYIMAYSRKVVLGKWIGKL